MSNWYSDIRNVGDALGLAASATQDHDQLRLTLETDSRLIDEWIGDHVFPQETTRYFTAVESMQLRLDRPLLSITALRTDSSGNASYGTTMTTAQYHLTPYNALTESPPQPYWGIELRTTSTGVFPAHVKRGVEIAGRWGRYDQRDTSTAVLSTDANATTPTLEVTGASSLYPGQTIRIGSEDMFVVRSPVTATAAHTSQVTVQRAVNGTTASTHSSATGMGVYTYPIVDRACLFQVQHDFKFSKADPAQGGGGWGEQGRSLVTEADLHPAVRRMLRGFRMPVVA